jgi:RimJ/RimL family protein N-acetyltransferase
VIPAKPLASERLTLEPLTAGLADALFAVLNDPALHVFTGGEPRSRSDLGTWIASVEGGTSPDGAELWCNWLVRVRTDGAPVGTVQATVIADEATLAWVIGMPFQGRGFAKEAAAVVASWLLDGGVRRFRATIHPDHAASSAVARSLGMAPTKERDDGEVVWRSAAPPATEPTGAG